MSTSRQNEESTGAWEMLHRGAEREGLDSPSRFDLSRVSTLVKVQANGKRHAPAPPPSPASVSPSSSAAQSSQPRSRVRPYARTGGRTRSDHDLALEAMVSTSDLGRANRGAAPVEYRAICDLCDAARSVAEIAAYLGLPLGVVKVLAGDMADAGLVIIHQTGLSLGDRSSREFMERVLQGLRAL
jgi:hypothetical protein